MDSEGRYEGSPEIAFAELSDSALDEVAGGCCEKQGKRADREGSRRRVVQGRFRVMKPGERDSFELEPAFLRAGRCAG